jgi:hypothetical protein
VDTPLCRTCMHIYVLVGRNGILWDTGWQEIQENDGSSTTRLRIQDRYSANEEATRDTLASCTQNKTSSTFFGGKGGRGPILNNRLIELQFINIPMTS